MTKLEMLFNVQYAINITKLSKYHKMSHILLIAHKYAVIQTEFTCHVIISLELSMMGATINVKFQMNLSVKTVLKI